MTAIEIGEFKRATDDLLRAEMSASLRDRVHGLLDSGGKDLKSLEDACAKVQKMVALFVAKDKASAIEKRYGDLLLRARVHN